MRFSQEATRVLNHACVEAHVGGAARVAPAHLLIALCKFGTEASLEALTRRGVDLALLRRRIRLVARRLGGSGPGSARPTNDIASFSREAGAALLDAERAAARENREADCTDLLRATLQNPDSLLAVVIKEENLELGTAGSNEPKADAGAPPWQKQPPTTALDRFGVDLTQKAKDGKLSVVVGRRNEQLQMSRILFKREKNNVVLVGEAGVGKTRIVEGFAAYGVQPQAPKELQELRIIALQPGLLLAGAKYRGDLEERLGALLAEAQRTAGIVLFFDELHALLSSENDMTSGIANLLKPALARGELRCIGATTLTEYERHIEKDAALARRFEQVRIEEPSAAEAEQMLQGARLQCEADHKVSFDADVVAAAVQLSVRYLPERRLPDKARDLLERAAISKRIVTLSRWSSQQDDKPRIQRDDVAAAVAEITGLPVTALSEDMRTRLQRLEPALRERVIGQDAALSRVTRVVRTALSGLSEPERPYGVLLFAGPSGVGKTELARALAEFLFLDEKRLLRFDMSELMEEHSISKLIGSPPGFVGHKQGGQLTDAVRRAPYSVVLLDEIEKAHPRILDVFLQVFDSGRLKDGQGRLVDFRNTLIILTSNLKPEARKGRKVGFRVSDEVAAPEVESERRAFLLPHFRPELINRLSDVVEFQTLGPEDLYAIIDKLVRAAKPRLEARGVQLELDQAAREVLIARGYDERFGARELGRAFEQLVIQPLADGLLDGKLPTGVVRAECDAQGAIRLTSKVPTLVV